MAPAVPVFATQLRPKSAILEQLSPMRMFADLMSRWNALREALCRWAKPVAASRQTDRRSCQRKGLEPSLDLRRRPDTSPPERNS
mmetsp:Transcript_44758/g.142892  ORF Transcript_44758/g.142892 Transcript_44758/m.142892 type:complete len:85 (-) Transcript_44758:361-615(-)